MSLFESAKQGSEATACKFNFEVSAIREISTIKSLAVA